MTQRKFIQDITTERLAEVVLELHQASRLGQDFVLLVVCSCMIATFGLIQNSAAVIIGAMLIAPLMSPILGTALALVRGDLDYLPKALGTLLIGTLLAVGLSTLLGLLVTTGTFNFLAELPSEILGRTQPNLFDLFVALAGGSSASYALSNPRLSAALPGVAIATALMPPLCVVGIGLALQQQEIWTGALILFFTNFVAIVCAASLVFALVGFRPMDRKDWHGALSWSLVVNLSLLLVLVLPLSASMITVAKRTQMNLTLRRTLIRELERLDNSSLVDFNYTQRDEQLSVVATIRAKTSPTLSEARQIQDAMAGQVQLPIALKLLVIPFNDLDPLAPPTPSPAQPAVQVLAESGATTPSATVTASPTPAPTEEPTTLPTVASATLTPTPPPAVYAVIGGAGGAKVNGRRFAGLSAIIAQLSEGTTVLRTGVQATSDGEAWGEVVLPDGRVVWVAERFLVPLQLFSAP